MALQYSNSYRLRDTIYLRTDKRQSAKTRVPTRILRSVIYTNGQDGRLFPYGSTNEQWVAVSHRHLDISWTGKKDAPLQGKGPFNTNTKVE